MGMSTYVVAIRPPDAKWQQMKAVWDACHAAGVAAPPEVVQFFNYEDPDPAGVVLDISRQDGTVTEWSNEDSAGLEVDLKALPADVTRLRFCNSW
jgi:hypothetical protein